ncbi:MAG: protoheme IX farnesyltransferase, partial [Pyrobaculum sp.]
MKSHYSFHKYFSLPHYIKFVSPYISLLKPRVIWLLILASVAGYIYVGVGV